MREDLSKLRRIFIVKHGHKSASTVLFIFSQPLIFYTTSDQFGVASTYKSDLAICLLFPTYFLKLVKLPFRHAGLSVLMSKGQLQQLE